MPVPHRGGTRNGIPGPGERVHLSQEGRPEGHQGCDQAPAAVVLHGPAGALPTTAHGDGIPGASPGMGPARARALRALRGQVPEGRQRPWLLVRVPGAMVNPRCEAAAQRRGPGGQHGAVQLEPARWSQDCGRQRLGLRRDGRTGLRLPDRGMLGQADLLGEGEPRGRAGRGGDSAGEAHAARVRLRGAGGQRSLRAVARRPGDVRADPGGLG